MQDIGNLQIKANRQDSLDSGSSAKTPKSIIKGNQVFAQKISFKNQTFDACIVDLEKVDIHFNHADSAGNKFKSISKVLEHYKKLNKDVIFITNGGIFKPDLKPEGLYVEEGYEWYHLNEKNGTGNFYLKPNGFFYVTKWGMPNIRKSADYWKIIQHIRFATQSGPLLVINGEINKQFTEHSANKTIRSGVGITSNKKIVFIISNEEVSFYDFACVFKEQFGCSDAIYLDGLISKMYLPEIKRFDTDGIFSVFICATKK
jgi:uncharacterized protein YigE (DUF2233 family)